MDRAANVDALVDTATRQLVERGALAARTAARDLREAYELFRAHARAMHAYVPSRWEGPLHYVRALGEAASPPRGAGAPPSFVNAARDWRGVAEHLRVSESPGNHFTMLGSPHVRELRDTLVKLISGDHTSTAIEG
jgi:thioesterase domain-containing protein